MNLEFLTGLALIVVTLGVVAYLIKEFFDIRAGDLTHLRRNVAAALEKRESWDAKPINSHLIGVIGKVTAHSADDDRPMRVRLSLESWPARLKSKADGLVPVGASVEVTEVDGPVLVVQAVSDAERAPSRDE